MGYWFRFRSRSYYCSLYISAAAPPPNADERRRPTHVRATPPPSPTECRSQRSLDTLNAASDDSHTEPPTQMPALSDQILRDEKVPGPSQVEKRRAAIQHHSSINYTPLLHIISN
ncbi:hypothetical protein K0M31_020449 [Melipona bicolor]|uniref:Uncharacterized protein n=1 Tax=Melipona bicolor TaxID=60889 RepID=A0AA40FCH5_9HYME|nr:hypothetical protein K0M31_020449 [Melipona bicolor]